MGPERSLSPPIRSAALSSWAEETEAYVLLASSRPSGLASFLLTGLSYSPSCKTGKTTA